VVHDALVGNATQAWCTFLLLRGWGVGLHRLLGLYCEVVTRQGCRLAARWAGGKGIAGGIICRVGGPVELHGEHCGGYDVVRKDAADCAAAKEQCTNVAHTLGKQQAPGAECPENKTPKREASS
jgi:hypothetical protein